MITNKKCHFISFNLIIKLIISYVKMTAENKTMVLSSENLVNFWYDVIIEKFG